MKVNIWIHEDARFVYDNRNVFDEVSDQYNLEQNKYTNISHEKPTDKHIDDFLRESFDINHQCIMLETDFIDRISVGDEIGINCFSACNKLGKEILQLLIDHCDNSFILYHKEWKSVEEVELRFLLCHFDMVYEAVDYIRSAKIYK